MPKMCDSLESSITIINLTAMLLTWINSTTSCRHFYLAVQLVDLHPYCIVTVFNHFLKWVQELNVFQMQVFLSMGKL